MKQQFIIGNWKSNKTTKEAVDWLTQFKTQDFMVDSGKKLIICASFTLLPVMKEFITKHNMQLTLGVQNVSPFDPGPYTGEVNAFQVKEFAQYVIIGHSERRDNFHESEEVLEKKVGSCLKAGLQPIFCVQNENTTIPQGVAIVAYEPPGSISTVSKGVPDDPKDVEVVVKRIKENIPNIPVIYGGSVNPDNVSLFTTIAEVQGVLPGAASLDPQKFSQIAIHA